LVKEPLINMISFTGSTQVGPQVGSVASEPLKRVSLELGGNNPYIALDDTDIEAAASAGAWAAETKEQLGGIQILEARDLSHAVQLISQQPGFKYGLGPIEIAGCGFERNNKGKRAATAKLGRSPGFTFVALLSLDWGLEATRLFSV
jgi:hypothetical protein